MTTTRQKTNEIRWHGRGGQGVKTAAFLTAKALAATGKDVRGFPEYGPERMGAPLKAFIRVSDEPILDQSQVYEPDIVVVLDSSLIGSQDVLQGMPDDGTIIVNTAGSPDRLRHQLKTGNRKLFTVDAGRISREAIGRNVPNTTMIGALVKASGLVEWEPFQKAMKAALEAKFPEKQDVVEGNMSAMEADYQEVTQQ